MKEKATKVNRHIKQSTASKVFDVFNVTLMLVFAFLWIYPFWNQLVIAFNEGADTALGGLTFWPREFTLENFSYILNEDGLLRGTIMSLLRVVVGTACPLFLTGLLAYVTTVPSFAGRNFVRFFFVVTMYVGGGMIPTYLLFTAIGLVESFWVYVIPGLFGAYNMILISSFMYGLPDSLAESARLDGANELTIYFRIILPLCKPVLAALAIQMAVGHWNAWFDVMLYNASGNFDTLQVYLRRILIESDMASRLQSDQRKMEALKSLTPASVKAATTMIVTIPIICVYPFFQKYFVGGITIGAVKG